MWETHFVGIILSAFHVVPEMSRCGLGAESLVECCSSSLSSLVHLGQVSHWVPDMTYLRSPSHWRMGSTNFPTSGNIP